MINDFTYNDLYSAYQKAKKSRKNKQEVYLFDQNREERLRNIYDELKDKKYKHGSYKKIIIYDSKKRLIYSPLFRDHIVHHLLYAKLYKTIDDSLLNSTFACRKGYGAHKGIIYLSDLIKQKPSNGLYYLKLDFSKYFFSINHDILKKKLYEIVKSEELRYIIGLVIDSYKSPKIYDNLLKESLFYIDEENKGIPIGSIISQLFANFFLNDIDKYIKFGLNLDFIRYMDDIIILGTKEQLNLTKTTLLKLVSENKLILNPKKISFNLVSDGLNFVGYRILNDKIYVGKSTKIKTNKFLDTLNTLDYKKFSKNDIEKINCSLQSRLGVFTWSSYGMNYFKNRGDIDFHSWG